MNFETKIDHKIPTQHILNTVCKSITTNMVAIQNFEITPNIFIHTGSAPILKQYIQKNKIKQKL
jgi:hypothetical protein